MSKLKERLVKKLNQSNFAEKVRPIEPDEIQFWKNGCRNDVVRWSIAKTGITCFYSATVCLHKQTTLKYSHILKEVVAEWPPHISFNEIRGKK